MDFPQRLAERTRNMGAENAFEVLARAKALEAAGRSVVHLEIGEPDFDTPENIVNTAREALASGATHYGPSAGISDLREAVAAYVNRHKGVAAEPEEVIITPGGKPVMFYTMMALVNPGDEVLYPNPGFPIYESNIRLMGGTPIPLPLLQENGFRLDLDDLRRKITKKTKLLIMNSPHNPTGSVLPPEDIEEIASICIENDIMVLADEIYDRVVFEGKVKSIASVPGMKERTIILDGFSKTYAMTGWRMGYGIVPREMVPVMNKLISNTVSCTATFTQLAGVEALTGPQDAVKRMVERFKARRDLMVDGLNRIHGIKCLRPQGAFYVFPDIRGLKMGSQHFADRLLQEAGVAGLAGTAFGMYGDGHLRFSVANSEENITEAVRRIGEFVSKI
jgi:aspartate/methionine/tyrosine aminotransferase